MSDALKVSALKVILEEEDLGCPGCGDVNYQEVGTTARWQGFTMIVEDGVLGCGDWHEYQTGDDCDDAYIECRSCLDQWPTLADLQQALLAAKRARIDADELELPDVAKKAHRPMMALSVLILDPRTRNFLECTDKTALDQAREALGLTTEFELWPPEEVVA